MRLLYNYYGVPTGTKLLIMDLHNKFMDRHNSFMDLHSWNYGPPYLRIMDLHKYNPFMDFQKWIMDLLMELWISTIELWISIILAELWRSMNDLRRSIIDYDTDYEDPRFNSPVSQLFSP